MPIRNAPSDSQEVTLRRWRVMEIEAQNGIRSRHVWGHDVKNGLGRASSPIIEFNFGTMTATTRSGRNYRLLGLPGNSRLGKHAWDSWCSSNEVVSELDVTNEYLNVEQLSTVELAKINSRQDSQ
jgi:hypothetical protein